MSNDLIIPDVPLTKTWLADVMEKKLGVRPTVGTSSTLVNGELGYMSMIRKVGLNFEVDGDDSEFPKSVVLKITTTGKGLDAIEGASGDMEAPSEADKSMTEQFMHNTECDYYRVLSAANEKHIKIPKIYALEDTINKTTEVPVIVMEMFENCHLYDLIQGFSENQLFKLVDEIVALHVFSLTTEEWKKIKPDANIEKIMVEFHAVMHTITDKLSDSPGMEILKVYSRNTFEKNPHFLAENGQQYLNGNRLAVIAHGDMWAPQILWDSQENIAGIIDWQIAHPGSPMEDLQHLLSTCTTVENRKRLTKPLIDHYYQKLSAGLEAKGVKVPWTREQIDEEYKFQLVASSAFTIFANGFWANSPILQTDGKPDIARITESFARCQSFIKETVEAWNME
ncbi:unnamed protein product [Caenorhabditis angaria]|uniref:CHK kinase-like domain-containing protein n=1 Tax=Caenorhabditis angaria TaxID=860376 RepID=A0A9P1N973_9PELO|nr:unnamed protein product [Caenorhabditis angaria]